ncbi:MAG TPA: outer membrane beta-barrel protein, partial [Bacteroidia bacterium]|nr:outer membrane beta-barrel protein [Bacteroidia bacterium]
MILEKGHDLKNVVVEAQKPFVEHQIDRTVYNIENSIIAAGNNGIEILKKLPGVFVDNNDGITIRGKAGVLVMLDGKTTYMSSTDLGNYLKSLDASQIEKIEVITNPSAKYDASGNAIINIILRKDKNLGFNAQVSMTYRQSTRNGGGPSINMDYRTHKFNFFGMFNLGIGTNENYSEQQNQYTLGGNTTTISDKEKISSFGVYNYGRLGADYTPDKRQTLGFSGEYFVANVDRTQTTTTSIHNTGTAADSSLALNGTGGLFSTRYNANLNYIFKIDSLGRELSANADFVTSSSLSNQQDITTYSYASSLYNREPTIMQYRFPSALTIMAAKVDYTQPLFKKGKLETGVKESQVNSDNPAQYWNVMQGVAVPDMGRTNHFIYKENIFSAYLNLSAP